MNKPITEYQTLVFDCDGVVLNSNKIKTQAFYDVAKFYGHEPAQALKDYHVQNGGISRFIKFEYLLTEILKKPLDQAELKQLLENFAHEVKKALMTCEVAEVLAELREQTKHANWLIVSGGDQAELREVFQARGLDHYFDGGIFGSPDVKEDILQRELSSNNIHRPALFIGDSKYDHLAAEAAEIDFVFLSQWTEVKQWKSWVEENQLSSSSSLETLVEASYLS
jgi:HAD superfamily hydrolase (TIGR01549 family)